MKLSEELKWRGFVNQTTFTNTSLLDKRKHKFYWGVDPSAPSMTIGNLAAAMMVRVFIEHGYEAVLLVGGATGLIGDPDGKTQERDLKTPEEVAKNKAAIIKQYEHIFAGEKFAVVDNYDWFKDMNYLEFLRTVGKHVPLRQMVNREFVQARLGEGGAGISYAEFSYSLIQGYDFLHLYEKHGVTLQVAASDQWGNSIAGVDLIRRKTGGEAHVWTTPLVINKTTGVKFGKSEAGAVWLDENATSVYKFYQFWLNLDDEGVEDYLKIYTPLQKPQIDEAMSAFAKNKSERYAQKLLAHEVTKLVHGEAAANMVRKVTEVLFRGEAFAELSADEIAMLKNELPTVKAREGVVGAVVSAGFAGSNSEARRLIEGGAIKLNGKKLSSHSVLDEPHAGQFLLQKGKNNFAILEK